MRWKAVLGALVSALAAALLGGTSVIGITGGAAQVGLDNVTCDADGVGLSYTIDGSGLVTKANVTGISPACISGHNKLMEFDTDASEGGPLLYFPIASDSHSFVFPTPVPISAIHTARISILGGD